MRTMPRAYVAGALVSSGGAYMAYHLGRILQRHFGYEAVDVQIYPPGDPIFTYDTPMRTVTLAAMEREAVPEDLLVINPFFSHFLFGLRLPGRKIMYVQDYRTFSALDGGFDLYVSVSSLVQRFLRAVYGLKTPVIPAFIQLRNMPMPKPWRERPPQSILAFQKETSHEQKHLMEWLAPRLHAQAPDATLELIKGRGLPHRTFMEKLGGHRYFLNLTPAEGFGLVPLEAMAQGATVTGLNGLAGADYMRPGKNCATVSVMNLPELADRLLETLRDEALAERLAAQGAKTAQRYGYAAFRNAWIALFAEFLRRAPNHA